MFTFTYIYIYPMEQAALGGEAIKKDTRKTGHCEERSSSLIPTHRFTPEESTYLRVVCPVQARCCSRDMYPALSHIACTSAESFDQIL